MTKVFCIFLMLLTFGISGCRKSDEGLTTQNSSGEGVLQNRDWTGTYEGTSTHTYGSVNSSLEYVEYVSQYVAFADVKPGSTPLHFNVRLTFEDGSEKIHNDIAFTNEGLHTSNWGSASSAGSLNIQFTENQLSYHYTQNCGNSCKTEIEAQLSIQ